MTYRCALFARRRDNSLPHSRGDEQTLLSASQPSDFLDVSPRQSFPQQNNHFRPGISAAGNLTHEQSRKYVDERPLAVMAIPFVGAVFASSAVQSAIRLAGSNGIITTLLEVPICCNALG